MKLAEAPRGSVVQLVDDGSFGVVLEHGRNARFIGCDLWHEQPALLSADAEVRLVDEAAESMEETDAQRISQDNCPLIAPR
jgi:hypothetical protein